MEFQEPASCSTLDEKINKFTSVFQTGDYVVLGVVLAFSACIGLFFAFKDRKKSAEVYTMGGGEVSPYSIALSLATTFFSSITILGTPIEFYRFGTMFFYFAITYLICCILAAEFFGPMYKKFNLTSMYEYLELRYNRFVRLVATAEFIVQTVFYVGVVIYTPALALEAVSGLNVWAGVWLTGGVCIFYTALGGLKAVVWTDSFQIFCMFGGLFAIIGKGFSSNGGYDLMISEWREGGRNVWDDFSFDPRVRHTFWSIVIGGVLGNWGNSFCTSQAFVQRMLATKDLKDMRKAIYTCWIFATSMQCVVALFTGVVVYSYFKCCDPEKAGFVENKDSLLPYLTVEIFQDYPGVAGLYVAGAFSGTLSTASSGINSMSTCIVTDFLQPVFKLKERTWMILSKLLALAIGLCCIAFAYIAANLGGVLQAAMSINSMLGGPTTALFVLSFFNPWVGPATAVVSYLAGIGMAVWVFVGSKIYPPRPEFSKQMHLEVSGCNLTNYEPCELDALTGEYPDVPWCDAPVDQDRPGIASLYEVSYMWLGAIGFFTTVLIGCVLSLIPRLRPKRLKEGVLHPFVEKRYRGAQYIPKK